MDPAAAGYVNTVTDAIVAVVQPAFRGISCDARRADARRAAGACLVALADGDACVVALALRSGGGRLAVFAVLALGYILLAGYWPQSTNTLALVLLAVPISTVLGFVLGVLGYAVRACVRCCSVALDLMQTVPAFAYLIPLLLLFGFGPVVGLIASAIYATPPMVRNTMLGLDRVPSDISEAGLMSGCTRRQQFWQVEVPTAMPQLLVGFNQTTMAALSHGHRRRHHRRFRGYRLGGALLDAQGRVRPEHPRWPGHRAARHPYRPPHHRLRPGAGPPADPLDAMDDASPASRRCC